MFSLCHAERMCVSHGSFFSLKYWVMNGLDSNKTKISNEYTHHRYHWPQHWTMWSLLCMPEKDKGELWTTINILPTTSTTTSNILLKAEEKLVKWNLSIMLEEKFPRKSKDFFLCFNSGYWNTSSIYAIVYSFIPVCTLPWRLLQ